MDIASMMNVTQIADAIGRKEIADTVSVRPTAVSNAIARGAFPASWYLSIKVLCEARGLKCETAWFAMVQPSSGKGAAA
ncbi:hypothetical protein DD556_17935 [Phaeobacter sp. JL2872]|nr:hypothetical protein DD556_17935 [Phaeobacter sp. JL2872]